MNPIATISKPRKTVVPIAVGLAWGSDSTSIFQEKMDGRFEVRTIEARGAHGEFTLAGELMSDGLFFAFDCLVVNGVDVRAFPLSERLKQLESTFASFLNILPIEFRLLRSFTSGGDLLKLVLARGGEGIVKKCLDAPWGTPMIACKRSENFYCIVTAMGSTQSVEIARILDSTFDPKLITHHLSLVTSACGSVKLGGGKCDKVRVGSILKLTGFGLTANNMIREPRPDADSINSWLVKY